MGGGSYMRTKPLIGAASLHKNFSCPKNFSGPKILFDPDFILPNFFYPKILQTKKEQAKAKIIIPNKMEFVTSGYVGWSQVFSRLRNR